MQSDFNITRVIETLRSTAIDIEQYGRELNGLRIKHALVLADLRDKEQDARQKYFEKKVEIKLSELSMWLKFEVFDFAREEEKLRHEIKRIEGLLDTLIETNNSLKFAAKLAHIETSL